MKKILSKLVFVLPLLFALVASHRLWQPGYFSMQDDMHVFRLQQFDQCVTDFQIPCRLISTGGFGYSYPLFNFYSPLPYAYSEIFHLLGFTYIDSLKISFITPFFIGSVGMFLLASYFFGPIGGLVSSVLYTFAPYHAIDAFVRGALAEHWALGLLPLVLYSLQSKKALLFILSFTALILSHNLTLLYFLPLLLIFSYFNKNLRFLVFNSAHSFLLSSFFILPAYFEKNLTTVNTMTQGYFQYIIHFVTINQLFISRFWGYGASLWGPVDDMSFQVGYLHWLIPIIATVVSFKTKQFRLILYILAVGLLGLFLTHNRSTFIWQSIPLLAYYQFPWRFLGLVIFCFSFIAGAITKNKFIITFIIIATIFLNINYFKEDIWYSQMTDSQKLSTAEVYRQSGAGLRDYWPNFGQNFPTTMAPAEVISPSDQIQNIVFTKTSKNVSGEFEVISPKATVLFPVVFFPNWNLSLNGQKTNYDIDQNYGQLKVSLPKGKYQYLLEFKNTPLRTVANALSIFGIGLYIIKLYREKLS